MTREEALNKAINIVAYFEAHFAKSKEAREEATNIIEALEQEPCDAVSRKAVLEVIRKCHCEEWVKADIGALIEALSPVTAEKVGHWIDVGGGQECSECGEIQYGYDSFRKYCANCGAKMEDGEI